jgi:hypothetical protein
MILRGCGGDPQEWVDGINEVLTNEKILLNGSKFNDISVFQHGGSTNILFNFDGAELDVGKLALWRLQTHSGVGGTWLSDYLVNALGVDPEAPQTALTLERSKPEAPIIGADGNIFNVLGIATVALKQSKLRDEAAKMRERVLANGNYDNALAIISEYVEPVPVGGMDLRM